MGMKRPPHQNNPGFTFGKVKKVNKWQESVMSRLEVRVALFVLLVSFVGGCISCFIIYNRSVDQVFETRVQHVRGATAYLSRALNADAQQSIVASANPNSKNYLVTKKVMQNFLRTFPSAFRAVTIRVKGKNAYYIVDGGQRQKKGEFHHSARINQQIGSPSPDLLTSFKKGTPQVERVVRSSYAGSFVRSYFPLKSKDGKVKAMLSVDMQFDGFDEDTGALLGAFKYGLVATGIVSILLSFLSGLFLFVSRKEHGTLKAEVIEQRKKLSKTQDELNQAVTAGVEVNDSLVATLSNAGCLVWFGQAFRSPARLDWEGTLKYEPHFEWLASDIRSGLKFHEAWDERRNVEDHNVWEKLLSFAFENQLSTMTTEYRINVSDVQELWFEEQLEFEYEPDGSVVINGFVRDVTESKLRNDEIRRLAYYDTVTGLINRARIHEVINEMLVTNPNVSVIGIEIGNFRNINESWGAEVADKLLHEFGKQLFDGVGSSGIVGRLAGDDFVIIVNDPYVVPGLVELLNKVCMRPTTIGGVEIPKVCRLGYVTADENENSISLLRKANLALENARKSLVNAPVCYKPEMSFKAKMRVELETAMRQALIEGEFYLMFQPIYCNVTKKLVKAEALLRWNSSRFGPISPGTFIPIAEETDFINDLGNFVINETAKTVKEFIDVTKQQDIVISLNMSLRQLKNQSTISILENAVEKWNIDRKNLLVEITESSIMDDSGACIETLHKLQKTGYSLAIDDFGTGYSSLATLASLPFDCLKIDKRFVDGIGVDKKQEDVLETIVRLARALNLQIVAEGIELESQWEFLAGLGVEYSQGYYFARPLPFEEFVLKADKAPKAA
jgi:diguanylate cyclase (GGDEF)-like protein